ncbi:MAG: alpha/beta fold hydrolase [Deltaproteobacteria bacterium]
MAHISVNGDSIGYGISANFDGSRPAVLFIHGAGQSALTWRFQEDIIQKYSSIVPDLPGHCASGGEGLGSVAKYRDFLKAFADALGLEKLVLVGHSMGGAIASLYALRYPEAVRAIILVGTGAKLTVAKETLSIVENDYERFCQVAPNRAFAPSACEELKAKFTEGLIGIGQKVCYHDLVACDEFDITAEVDRISTRALIISGGEDLLTPAKYGEYLHRKIAGSTLSIIENAGHFMMQEAPEEFNGILAEFLESL